MALSNQRWLNENGQIPEDDLQEINQIPAHCKPESQKMIWWNQQHKAIFRGQAKSLSLDKAIPKILKPQNGGFMFLSQDCTIKI
jgi:hypothetical protein